MVSQATVSEPLSLQLFGWWRLRRRGLAIELGGREQRLVALLGLRGTRPRLHIAATLWPDTAEEKALGSLRAAVMRTQRRAPGLLVASRTTIGLHPRVFVDVQDMMQSIEAGAALGGDGTAARVDPRPILECEELLPGWYDDWVLLEREHLQQLRLRTLESMASRALEQEDFVAALDAARAATGIEPLLESTRSITILALIRLGDPAGAVREFQGYRRQLFDELGVEPSPQFADLLRPLIPAQRHRPGLRRQSL
jgi:DNA-binding SARP family transcriptional activator